MEFDLNPNEFEATAKAVMQACAAAEPEGRAALLAEAGLIGVSVDESVGGLGLPLDFAVPVLAAAGDGLLGFPLIDAMLISRAFAGVDTALAEAVVSGDSVVTIAWQGVAEDCVVGAAAMGDKAEHVLMFRADGSAVLARTGNGVQAEPMASLDIDAPEARFVLNGPIDGVQLSADAVETLRSDAMVMRSAFVRGSAERCLTLAVDYAQERSQFGKLLSANQVIRHRLSRDKLATETMRNALTRALTLVPGGDVEMARQTCWLATAAAGISVAESAIQVFGGMGFTWEVPLHRHLRQIRTQAQAGSYAEQTEALGLWMIETSKNPWYGEIANVV
ncbi:acyl-CoA dehydrogenase (plasmid) [Sulfitobacter sp. W027]|uniref:acyl-CoA dehydrogenase n=1 Tax=Sulfitobacter sp. W027 TaxID=2867025 RepID=UPI0021A7B8F3|nr:acyl-CoA dehydrogenase [Sulfitobacter sp. W027]UWR35555.1 acyl-CoA dehydrogenase [Sulfitobacter sp. W027]